jgi:SNF2 family DNA or RNA helicase
MLLKLRPAQLLAYRFLRDHNEAALFMGCGLGKTSTCLMIISKLLLAYKTRGFLVVAPKRVCNLVWPYEAEKWDQLSWLKVANLNTPEGLKALHARRAHVYVIGYERLPQFMETYLKGRRIKDWAFDSIIFDELTRAKNHKSKRIRAVQKYVEKLDRRWGMTGTPVSNGMLDLFGQIKILDGGKRLGRSFNSFRDHYFKPKDYRQYRWIIKSNESETALQSAISDMTLVLKSSDYLKIPNTLRTDIEVALPPIAVKAYRIMKKKLLLILRGEEISSKTKATLLNKLLQITSGVLYSDEGAEVLLHDAKIKAAVAFVKQKKEPIIIACNFRHEQSRLLAAIKGSVRFDAAKTEKQQQSLQAQWNRKEIPVLIAHPASLGHGLNMQEGGRMVLWFSPTFNKDHYDQLNARVARTGQTEVTEFYHLLCSGTIDDYVMTSLLNKDSTEATLTEALKLLQKRHGYDT